ncbi:MAG: serine protease [Capsulimonadaceae bacterium]
MESASASITQNGRLEHSVPLPTEIGAALRQNDCRKGRDKVQLRPLILALAIVAGVMIVYGDLDWNQLIEPARPSIPADSIVRPSMAYGTEGRHTRVGSSFVLEEAGRRVLVTAFHLLPVHADKAATEITSVGLVDPDGVACGSAGHALLHDGFISNGTDLSGDCALFGNPQTSGNGALQLAHRDVALGDRVWIAGYPIESRTLEFVAARVVSIRDKSVLLRLREPTAMIGLSGAPVLSTSGEVVGMDLMCTGDLRFAGIMRLGDLRANLARGQANAPTSRRFGSSTRSNMSTGES